MNLSSATVAADVDEFELAGLTPAPSRLVRPPRVEGAPAAFECKAWKTVELDGGTQRSRPNYTMVIGMVVGIHIDDRYVSDGLVDAGAMRPIARLGYMNYSVLGPEQIFGMDRPRLDEAGEIIPPEEAPAWDGIYR
jgi:flavin reductase (DIM6/NTAB) family NADH-FMN oxidoreductase RutF